MAPPHPSSGVGAGPAGVGAEEFVVMLWHLAEASNVLIRTKGGGGAGGRPAGGKGGANANNGAPPPFEGTSPTMGRLREMVARLMWFLQSAQDLIGAISNLLCLWTLRLLLRVLSLSPCLRCCGRAKGPGQVDKITSVHWATANVMVQLQGQRRERISRHKAVHEFLCRHKISSLLSLHVRRHVDRSAADRSKETGIESSRRVSTEIIVNLMEEMHVPVFSVHPFFVNLRTKHPHLVRELCHEALQPMLVSLDEIVFCANEVCSRMYIVISGHVQYCANVQQRDSANSGPALVRRTLHEGKWVSEAALWTGWVHRGELRAVTDCLLFALDASGFARVISSHKSAHAFAAAYARKFVEGLNRGLQTDLVDAGPIDQ